MSSFCVHIYIIKGHSLLFVQRVFLFVIALYCCMQGMVACALLLLLHAHKYAGAGWFGFHLKLFHYPLYFRLARFFFIAPFIFAPLSIDALLLFVIACCFACCFACYAAGCVLNTLCVTVCVCM